MPFEVEHNNFLMNGISRRMQIYTKIARTNWFDKEASISIYTFSVTMSSKISKFFCTFFESLGLSSKEVSKTSLKSAEQNVLSLKIVSSKFGTTTVEAADTDNGHAVKLKALDVFLQLQGLYYSSTDEIEEVMKKYELQRVKTRVKFSEAASLESHLVKNNEVFLLVPSRHGFLDPNPYDFHAGPTKHQIQKMTEMLPKSPPTPPPVDFSDMLLQDDMRKIFITLAQECAYVLGASPLADKMIAYFRQRIHNYIKHHENAMMVMTQLGFPIDKVKKAMKLKANNTKAALDWLIENVTSTGVDEGIAGSPRTSREKRSSLISSCRRGSILSTSFVPTGSFQERVDGLLEIVKFYAETDELVYQENISDMVLMGYEAEVAQETLRLTRNDVAAAIAHIHGDESPSITELRDGFSETSEVRKKIMESIHIQFSLSSPVAFIFYVTILDNPTQASSWIPNSNVGSLMMQIIMKYHDEKHFVASNQFNQSRLPISALSAPNWSNYANLMSLNGANFLFPN